MVWELSVVPRSPLLTYVLAPAHPLSVALFQHYQSALLSGFSFWEERFEEEHKNRHYSYQISFHRETVN
jgi:hypothetical protein